jgi:hypothetical protein
LFLCLASSNISKGQFQKEDFHLLFPFPFATARCKIFYALHRALHRAKDLSRSGFHRAVDFIAQWISSRSGFHRAVGCCHRGCSSVDVIAQWMLSRSRMSSRSGCHRAVDVVAHRMLSRRGCHHAVDFIAQWICHAWDVVAHRMFSRRGCHHTVDFIAQWISSRSGFSCAQATGRTAQMTGLVVNFKINF